MAPANTMHDYYAILEVEQTASISTIKKSYHRLALLRHPDKNPNDPKATEKFQLLSEAWETLNDETERREYDRIYPYIPKAPRTSSQSTAAEEKHAGSRNAKPADARPGSHNAGPEDAKTKSGASEGTHTKPRNTEQPKPTASELAEIQRLRQSISDRSARWDRRQRTLLAEIAEIEKIITRLKNEIKILDIRARQHDAKASWEQNWPKANEDHEVTSRARQELHISKVLKERKLDIQRTEKEKKEAEKSAESDKVSRENAEEALKIFMLERSGRNKQDPGEDTHKREAEEEAAFRKKQADEKAAREREAARKKKQAEEEAAREKAKAEEALRKKRAAEQAAREREAEEKLAAFRKKQAEEREAREREVAARRRKEAEEQAARDLKEYARQQARAETEKRLQAEREEQMKSCAHRGWWDKVETPANCPTCGDYWKYLLECPGCTKLACPRCQAEIREKLRHR